MQHDITQYYVNQAGSGIGHFYSGSEYQKGYGLGSFLGGLARRLLPLIRGGAQAVGREAARAGAHVLADIAAGDNARESLIRHAGQAKDNLVTRLKRKAHDMTGSGNSIKRRKVVKRLQLKPIRRSVKISKDIFS